ncbi:transmembrane protein, putative [Rhizophagus clarus]|uniref:Transmembrane protein, putative n=1 Tax=Rhizophagus clarus TaxID=94130 RepID=A0A8H3L105_9GLOM|nr:transmembrane protein, putative [Rhizophagus clarus]
MYSKNDDFIESKKPIIYGFPEDYFYLKVSPLSQDYVLDVKRSSIFFGFGEIDNGKLEGYIALESHPKYVIDVKGGNVKDRSRVVLSDSGTKSFTQSNFAKWEIVSSNKKHHNESAIGIIRLELVEAEGLRCVDSFLAGGLSDPYVRVFHEGGQDIIAQTRVIDNTLNPVWDEVCCIPVKNIDDKFILEVMDFNLFTKHKPLGIPNGIDRWDNLSIEGKLHYRAKFIPLNLDILPKPTSDFLANLKEKPFDKLTLYFLVTLRAQNGNFPPSNTIATFFGYFDIERLFNFLVLGLLRYLFKENREWTSIYGCSEQYISRELGGDLEIEEVVIDSGRKTVREIFKIKTVNAVPIVSQAVTTTNDDHEVVDIEDS